MLPRPVDVVEHRQQRLEHVTDRALLWLERRPPGPFLLFAHYFDTHWPYEAPDGGAAWTKVGGGLPGAQCRSVSVSPDGKLLAFQRDRKELRVLDLASGKDRRLAAVQLDGPPLGSHRPFDWSPDGRWIAVLSYGERMFRNLLLVPVDGGEPRPASFLAHTNADDVTWSPDATYVLFATNQRSEPGQLARIDLVAQPPRFREDRFRDLFQTGKSPQATTVTTPAIAFEGLRQRTSLLPLGLDVGSLALASDGKNVALIANAAGQLNVWSYSLDPLAAGPAAAPACCWPGWACGCAGPGGWSRRGRRASTT